MKNKKAGIWLWILILLIAIVLAIVIYIFFSSQGGSESISSLFNPIPKPPALPD